MGAESTCSACGTKLGPPHNGSNVVCPACGAIWNRGAAITPELSAADSPAVLLEQTKGAPLEGAQELLAELDEKIGELAADIEGLRSREQGAPLELGCALFGVFSIVILVLACFATIARPYFGGSVFYLVLAIAILAGLYRIAPKIIGRRDLTSLSRQRAEMEATLAKLKSERERVETFVS